MASLRVILVPLGVLTLATVPPAAVLYWLLIHPRQNTELLVPFEHFVIVSNVSLLALVVALLLIRSTLQTPQAGMLFLALGFMSMAGLFGVHALATPGVMVHGSLEDYGGSLIGLSAYLSLLVPSLFFAARYTPLGSRSAGFFRHQRAIVLVIAGGLALYAVLGLSRPHDMAQIPLSTPPTAYVVAAVTILLLIFAAWRQAESYGGTRLPMYGALVLAYLWLAEAQVAMVLAPVWTLAWWEYHVLMLAAVVLALGALFVQLDRLRGLERFLPATVVERVAAGDTLRLGGERRVVTILFADLRGSTALAERLPAEAMVELLNTYLGALARSVFQHLGILDKFLGDGLMAIFGVVETDPSAGAVPAARAALAMRKAVALLNADRVARGEEPVYFGVGVHTGEVILGSIGLPERSDYTAIGDTVNTAARLENVCKEFGVDSILSVETVMRLDGAFVVQALGEVMVEGKSQPIRVSTLG